MVHWGVDQQPQHRACSVPHLETMCAMASTGAHQPLSLIQHPQCCRSLSLISQSLSDISLIALFIMELCDWLGSRCYFVILACVLSGSLLMLPCCRTHGTQDAKQQTKPSLSSNCTIQASWSSTSDQQVSQLRQIICSCTIFGTAPSW